MQNVTQKLPQDWANEVNKSTRARAPGDTLKGAGSFTYVY